MAMMRLPDGRNLDIQTERGALEFLDFAPDFVTRNLSTLKSGTGTDDRFKVQTLQIFRVLGVFLPPTRRGTVAEDQKRAIVDLAREWCLRDAANPRWVGAGALPQATETLLDVLTPWTQDRRMCALLVASGAAGCLGAYAKLCQSCRCPPPSFVEALLMTCCNVCTNLEEASGDEGGLELLDATGLLAQVFRVSILPGSDAGGPALAILGILSGDNRFVRKQLGPHKPSGKALAAAAAEGEKIAGGRKKRGVSEVPPALDVVKLLTKLARQANLISTGSTAMLQLCRCCSLVASPGQKLLACSKCRMAHYCSKECQRADWKAHKKLCALSAQVTNSNGDGGDGKKQPSWKDTNSLSMNFVQSQVFDIRAQLRATAARKEGKPRLKLAELVLEVDFMGAALERGEFRVYPVDHLRRRVALPDWFHAGTEVFEGNFKGFLESVDGIHATLQAGMVLTLVRSPSGVLQINRVALRTADGTSLFSDDHLAMSDEDALVEDLRLKFMSFAAPPRV